MAKKVEIVDDEGARASGAQISMCRELTNPLLLDDNLIAVCAQCFKGIQHRPNLPVANLIKLCEACVYATAGDPKFIVTKTTVDEVRDYFIKKGD